MTASLDDTKLQQIQNLLYSYFPDCNRIKNEASLQSGDGNEVLYQPERILSYLQTAFFEEHLLEVQIDQSTRVFFTNLLDDLPDLIDYSEDDDLLLVEPDYETGSYLKKNDSLVLTPLTPGGWKSPDSQF